MDPRRAKPSLSRTEESGPATAGHASETPRAARQDEGGRSSRWYVGAQNDGLFIIDQPPRPSTDDITEGPASLNVIAKVYDGPDALARAEFIVRACNAHYELVAALKANVEAWRKREPWKVDAAVTGALVAIAKAEGR